MITKHKLRDDCIIHNDSVASVIAVHPINEEKYSEKKLQDLKVKWGNYLLSIDHPIQIVGRTVNLELDSEIAVYNANVEPTLKKHEDKRLLSEWRSFYEWLKITTKEKCLPSRMYFLVISAGGTDDTAKKVLQKRSEHALHAFEEMKIKARRLTTAQIESYLASYKQPFIVLNKKKSTRLLHQKSWLRMWRKSK